MTTTQLERQPPPAEPRAYDDAVETLGPLGERLATSNEQFRRILDEWKDAVELEGVSRLREAARQMASQHGTLLATLEAAALQDPTARWPATSGYREQIAATIMPRALELFGGAGTSPAARFSLLTEVALKDMYAVAATYGDVERCPDATGLYRARPGDRVWERAAKGARRVTRRISRTARRVATALRRLVRKHHATSLTMREVPARHLVQRHVSMRLASRLVRQLEENLAALSTSAAALEDGFMEWAQTLAQAERAGDDEAHHVPPHLPDTFRERAADEDGDQEAESTWFADALAAARELQTALDRLANEPASATAVAADEIERVCTELLDDFLRAGALQPKAARGPGRIEERVERQLARTSSSWAGWWDAAHSRVRLVAELLSLRAGLLSIEEELLGRFANATVRPLATTCGHLKTLLEETANSLDWSEDHATTELVNALHATRTRLLANVERALSDVAGLVSCDEALGDPGRPEWDRMLELIDALPAELRMHGTRPADQPRVYATERTVTLDVRAAAAKALAPPLPDQIKKASEKLRRAVLHAWDEADQVRTILAYNLTAAAEELAAPVTGAAPKTGTGPQDSEGPAPRVAAQTLVNEAFRRSASTLGEVVEDLAPPWQGLSRNVCETFVEDWDDLLRWLRADAGLEESWVGLRTTISRRLETGITQLEHTTKRMASLAQRLGRTGNRILRGVIRKGRAAVHVPQLHEEDPAAILAPLVHADTLLAGLPLVYRKLFSMQPLSEPSLFEARDRDLVALRHNLSRWQQEGGSGLTAVIAPLGSGRTSFLGLGAAKAVGQLRVVRIALPGRIQSSSEFARTVAEAFALPGTDTLEDLAAALENTPAERDTVCFIDNAEHLVFQAMGAGEPLRESIAFFTRTDRRVHWIIVMTSSAWHFVERTAANAASLAMRVPLTSITRDELERVILNRHEKSGMPLHFLPDPRSRDPMLLAGRLRRTRSPEAVQASLRATYFDALYRASGENLRLAFFYWLRSVDLEAEPDVLSIRRLEPIDFRFLASLRREMLFALRALLVHNTMDVRELAACLRYGIEKCVFIMESLHNARLVVRSDSDGGNGDRAEFEPGARFRIHPLALHPIVEELRRHHLLA